MFYLSACPELSHAHTFKMAVNEKPSSGQLTVTIPSHASLWMAVPISTEHLTYDVTEQEYCSGRCSLITYRTERVWHMWCLGIKVLI